MSQYQHHPKLPGATPLEREALKSLSKIEVKKGAKISRYFYDSFLAGNDVPDFVRIRIVRFLEKKAALFEGVKKTKR